MADIYSSKHGFIQAASRLSSGAINNMQIMNNKSLPLVFFAVLISSNALADSLFPKAGEKVRVGLREDGSQLGMLHSLGNALEFTDSSGKQTNIGQCIDTPVSENESPDENITASVFIRNCGATVDFSTIVSIDLEEKTYPVVAFAGKPNIKIDWRDDHTLLIRHSVWPEELIFIKAIPVDTISVAYSDDQESGEITDDQMLGYSSFNYGASGRAAGLPADLLLRVAGWSQEASGLYRPEWSHWTDINLCGDDPRGSKAILDGIIYFEQNYGGQKPPVN